MANAANLSNKSGSYKKGKKNRKGIITAAKLMAAPLFFIVNFHRNLYNFWVLRLKSQSCIKLRNKRMRKKSSARKQTAAATVTAATAVVAAAAVVAVVAAAVLVAAVVQEKWWRWQRQKRRLLLRQLQ